MEAAGLMNNFRVDKSIKDNVGNNINVFAVAVGNCGSTQPFACSDSLGYCCSEPSNTDRLPLSEFARDSKHKVE
jgi:hypothetical protein